MKPCNHGRGWRNSTRCLHSNCLSKAQAKAELTPNDITIQLHSQKSRAEYTAWFGSGAETPLVGRGDTWAQALGDLIIKTRPTKPLGKIHFLDNTGKTLQVI